MELLLKTLIEKTMLLILFFLFIFLHPKKRSPFFFFQIFLTEGEENK